MVESGEVAGVGGRGVICIYSVMMLYDYGDLSDAI